MTCLRAWSIVRKMCFWLTSPYIPHWTLGLMRSGGGPQYVGTHTEFEFSCQDKWHRPALGTHTSHDPYMQQKGTSLITAVLYSQSRWRSSSSILLLQTIIWVYAFWFTYNWKSRDMLRYEGNCNPLGQISFYALNIDKGDVALEKRWCINHMQSSLCTAHPLWKGSPGWSLCSQTRVTALLGHSRWTFLLIRLSTLPCLWNSHWRMSFCIPQDVKAFEKNPHTPRDYWC